jgi:CDP-glycerol glycerophosphotransferase (TagB/SpsB family)
MKQQLENIENLFKEDKISKELHDKAVELTNKHHPWVWKKNNDKITGINDIFGGLK